MPLGSHTLLLSLNGGLFAFGDNNQGQLGLGHKDNQMEPAEVPWNGPQPVQVDWGFEHSLILDAEGGVWEAGYSRSLPSSDIFQRALELPLITFVAAGESLSAAIDTEGGLWVWTSVLDNKGLSWASSVPQRLEDFPPLIKVACGEKFLVAEGEDGLWVLGNNFSRQLGLGHTNNFTNSALQPTLVQVEERAEGSLRCLTAFPQGVILIDSQGAVFSVGSDFRGQLGRSSGSYTKFQRINNIPPMLAASCGCFHTLALDENGSAWTWGWGDYGQLGAGNTSDASRPVQVPWLNGMTVLVAGRYHSLAFPQEGGLLVFGFNKYGQLGLNHRTNQTTPTLCPIQPALPHSFTRSRKKSARFL